MNINIHAIILNEFANICIKIYIKKKKKKSNKSVLLSSIFTGIGSNY